MGLTRRTKEIQAKKKMGEKGTVQDKNDCHYLKKENSTDKSPLSIKEIQGLTVQEQKGCLRKKIGTLSAVRVIPSLQRS